MVNKNINQKKVREFKVWLKWKMIYKPTKTKKFMQVSNRKLHTNTKVMWRDESAYEIACIVKCTKCLDIKYGPRLIKYIMLGKMTSNMDYW
jgi:hypothetical protein